MLGNGKVWYNKIDGEWRIIKIIGANSEEITAPSTGWNVTDLLINPRCFRFPVESGDYFEEFANKFQVSFEKLTNSPGAFFGNEITDYTPFKPSWCNNDDCEISLVNNLSKCSPSGTSFVNRRQVFNTGAWEEWEEWRKGSGVYSPRYSIIQDFDVKKCSALAPNIGSECLESYLISNALGGSGTAGADVSNGIYGLFQLEGVGLSIVPLLYFENRNEGLNYIFSEQETE